MLQKDLLFQHKKIIDNVSLPLVLRGMKKSDAREKAAPLFAEFGLEGTQYQYPAQLSGGMRQRAALLRTYLSSNGVALLDEPFSALDTITKSNIHKWYLDVMQHIDLSTLFITHDIDEAILLSDRIYILNGRPGHITDEIIIEEKSPGPRISTLHRNFSGTSAILFSSYNIHTYPNKQRPRSHRLRPLLFHAYYAVFSLSYRLLRIPL